MSILHLLIGYESVVFFLVLSRCAAQVYGRANLWEKLFQDVAVQVTLAVERPKG